MKLKYLFNLFLILIPLVLSSGCDDFEKSEYIDGCKSNEEGIITRLEIKTPQYTKEGDQINKLLLNDLTDLTFTIEIDGYSIESIDFDFPEAISNLKNLESLKLNYDYTPDFDSKYWEKMTLKKHFLKNLTNLKSLYIGNIILSQDIIDDISTLNNLEELTFYNSYLDESINYKSLSNLKKLKILNISVIPHDYLLINQERLPITIPEDLIKSNKGIKELALTLMSPINISKDDFPNLEKLNYSWYYSTKGDFDSSYVEQFDNITDLEFSCFDYYGWVSDEDEWYCNINADLSKLKNIKSLSVNKVQITDEFMNGVINLPNLEKLVIDESEIYDEKFNEKLNSLKSLTTLYLGNINTRRNHGEGDNDLNKLDLSLTNLRNLTLKDDYLKSFPDYVYSFKNLEYLDLSGNSFAIVDDRLSNLVNLKHLNLASNELINIPDQLINLKKLEYLDLSFNSIVDELPEYLNDLNNLKYFYINDNSELIGKVITNENLVECIYSLKENDLYDICIPKDAKEIKCLKPEEKIERCIDDDINVSTNGLCGKDHGKCPNGQCCGEDGKCSSTRENCLISKNCQIKYGSCINECQEINEYLVNNKFESMNCSVNKEGRVMVIDISIFDKTIEIDESKIQKLINQLPNLHSLEKLYIDPTGNMDLSPLKKIENLKILTIFNDTFTHIPDEIYSLTNLEYLEIHSYGVSEISSKIGNLINLKELIIYGIDAVEMPVEFGNLKNLEILDLSGSHNINNYQDFLGKLVNLKSLVLRGNNISDIPNDIGNLSKLETLDLYNNKIDELPKEFGKLKNLKNLNLYNNNINSLPKEFENLTNLEDLILSYNELTKFPEQIGKLKKLKTLLLWRNNIDDEIPKSYNDLSNLAEFNVHSNNNLKGEILTNKSLKSCFYGHGYELKNLCRHGTETCLDYYIVEKIKLCDTTTTTSKKAEPTVVKYRCGKDYGNCNSGECCSKYGWCGRSDEHCDVSKGCQSEFGECKNGNNNTTTKKTIKNVITVINKKTVIKTVIKTIKNTTTKKATTKKATTQTSVKPEPTVTNYRCGKEYGNAKCSNGECCSKYGWCGKSDKHCDVSQGCQSEFGKCNSTPSKSEPNTDGKCGEGYGKCPSGQCCSKYGWCGTTSAYCDSGCQNKYGKCN